MFGFRNMGIEGCCGRRVEVYSSPLQDFHLLQTWVRWTQIRAIHPAICFSQLVWNFKMLISDYWRRQNSRVGQWEYLSMRRVNFLVEQPADESSDSKNSLFGTSESGGRIIWSSYKIYFSHFREKSLVLIFRSWIDPRAHGEFKLKWPKIILKWSLSLAALYRDYQSSVLN